MITTAQATPKTALITGITGQDGSYLAEFLLAKGYTVHGIKRRSSSFNTQRIGHLYADQHALTPNTSHLILHYGDLSDTSNLTRIIQQTQPDEIYNLGLEKKTRFYASLRAVRIRPIRQTDLEQSLRHCDCRVAELLAVTTSAAVQRMSGSHGLLHCVRNDEMCLWKGVQRRGNPCRHSSHSLRRGETFVIRKITRGLANISQGLEDCLYLGNIDSLRDWGHAKDYVRMQWLMLQQDQPDDFVIATGKQYTVRQFINWTAEALGMQLRWEGEGVKEVAYWVNPLDCHVANAPRNDETEVPGLPPNRYTIFVCIFNRD